MAKRIMKLDAMQKRLDTKLGKDNYTIIGDYKGYDQLNKVKHKCGRIEEYIWKNLIKGVSKCRCEQSHVNKRDIEYHNEELVSWGRGDFECIEYKDARKSKNVYIHKVCGKTYESSLNAMKQAKHCPHCHGLDGSGLNKVTQTDAQKRLNKLYDNQYTILKYGVNTKASATILHKPCNTIYKGRLAGLLYHNINQCPRCMEISGIYSKKTATYEGIKFLFQGYEEHSLKQLVEEYGAKNIETAMSGKVQRFDYVYNGKRSKYLPDFFIPKVKLIVETKSLLTLGLSTVYRSTLFLDQENLFKRTQAKAIEVLKQKFKFRLDCYDDNRKLVKFPNNWMYLTRDEVLKYINTPKPRFQFYLALSANNQAI